MATLSAILNGKIKRARQAKKSTPPKPCEQCGGLVDPKFGEVICIVPWLCPTCTAIRHPQVAR